VNDVVVVAVVVVGMATVSYITPEVSMCLVVIVMII
jgi:hypothetical protein